MDTFFDGLVSDDELLEEEGHLQKLKVRDDEVLEAASKTLSAQLGVVTVVAILIGDEGMPEAVKMPLAANFWRMMCSSDSYILLEKVAKVLGLMAKGSESDATRYNEDLIAQTTKKLGEKWSRGRLAACLVTRELALNAPFLVQLHIEHLIPKLFHVMLDSRLETRTRAAETLKICLKNFYTWPATNLSAFHVEDYRKACDVLKRFTDGDSGTATEAEAHGALLVLLVLLECTESLTLARRNSVFGRVIELKGHASSTLVNETAMLLLIELARYKPSEFALHLEPTLGYLYDRCRGRTDQSSIAFKALGELALIMGADLPKREVPNIVQTLMSVFRKTTTRNPWKTTSRREKAACVHAAMDCIGRLTTLKEVCVHLPRLLTALLCDQGLSEQSVKTLWVVMDTLPDQKSNIKQRMVFEFSRVFFRKPCCLQPSIQAWLRPETQIFYRAANAPSGRAGTRGDRRRGEDGGANFPKHNSPTVWENVLIQLQKVPFFK